MKIRCNRGTLHLLPPHSAGWWEWCDVVDRDGSGDGVKPKHAHAARKLLEYDRERELWRTSRRLEEYLADQWGIELAGTVGGDAKQAELPLSTGSSDVESRVIGTSSPDSPTQSDPKLVQMDLNGDRAEDRLTEQAAEDYIALNKASDPRYCDASEMNTWQTTLDRYMHRVRVSSDFVKRTGDTYNAGTARVVVE